MGLFKKKKSKSTLSAGETQKTLHNNLEFAATEQYKLLRTNLEFTLPGEIKCPIIGVTSSLRGEGKSTTAINLSYVLAEKGSKVILIDGDLRLPSIAKKMGMPSSPGLTDLLFGKKAAISDFETQISKKWYIVPSGELPPNPSELLGSRRMAKTLDALKEHFDYIIVDLPPVNIVSDALSAAHLIDGMILVVREDYTEKKELERCMRQLKLSNVNVLGCVMNCTKSSGGAYKKKGKYYKYYKKEYGEEEA